MFIENESYVECIVTILFFEQNNFIVKKGIIYKLSQSLRGFYYILSTNK